MIGAHHSTMTTTKILCAQHDAAMAMAQRLLFLIDSYRDREDSYPIALQLAKLIGLLRIHLAHQDAQLYPWLATCADPAVAELARVYMKEMGSLALTIERFAVRWSSSAVIGSAFEQFRAATYDLIATIEVRIERENVYLYPMADMVAAQEKRAAA